MNTLTATKTTKTNGVFSASELTPSDKLSRFQTIEIVKSYENTNGDMVFEVLLNGEGKGPAKDIPYKFSEDAILACDSGTHYSQVKEVTATELAALVNDVHGTVFTIEFHKKWTPSHTSDALMEMSETDRISLVNNQTKFNRFLSKTNVGDYRLMTGIKPTETTRKQDLEARPPKTNNGSSTNRSGAKATGLIPVVDLNLPAGERLRHVNLKNVFSLIVGGTKYIRKGMKSHSQN